MANIYVSGCPDSAFDGTYSPDSGGTIYGLPVYVNPGGKYLLKDNSSSSSWSFCTARDQNTAVYYKGGDGGNGPTGNDASWRLKSNDSSVPVTTSTNAPIPAPTITAISGQIFHLQNVDIPYVNNRYSTIRDGSVIRELTLSNGTGTGTIYENSDYSWQQSSATAFPGTVPLGVNAVFAYKSGSTTGPTSTLTVAPPLGDITTTATTLVTPIPTAITTPAPCATATKLQAAPFVGGIPQAWQDVAYTVNAGKAVVQRATMPGGANNGGSLRWRVEFPSAGGGDAFSNGRLETYEAAPNDAPLAPGGQWVYPWDVWRVTVPNPLIARASAYLLQCRAYDAQSQGDTTNTLAPLAAGSTYDLQRLPYGYNNPTLFFRPYNAAGYGPDGAGTVVNYPPNPAAPAVPVFTHSRATGQDIFTLTAPALPQYGLELELFYVYSDGNTQSLGKFAPGETKSGVLIGTNPSANESIFVEASNHVGKMRSNYAVVYTAPYTPPGGGGGTGGGGTPPPPPTGGGGTGTTTDTTAPVVTIESPTAGARSGKINILATATDAVGVVEVKFFYNDLLLQVLAAPNSGTKWLFVWDTLSPQIANGSKIIRVEARDASGNLGSATVAIDVQNSLSNLTRKLVTKQIPTAQMQAAWKIGEQKIQKLLVSHGIESVSPEAFENYRIQALVHAPGDSLDEKQYQLLTPRRTQVILSAAGTTSRSTCRVMWIFTPIGVRAFWELGAANVVSLFAYNDGMDKLAIFTDEPAQLLSFDGKNVAQIYDLSALDVDYELFPAFAEGRWYLGLNARVGGYLGAGTGSGSPKLRALAGAGTGAAYSVELLDVPARIVAVCGDGGDKILCAINVIENDVEIEGRVIAFDPKAGADALQVLAVGLDPLSTLNFADNTVLAGGVNGEIYVAGALLHDVGATITALDKYDGKIYAVTLESDGNGRIHTNRSGGWQVETVIDSPRVLSLAQHEERLWAGGASAMLYRAIGTLWNEVETVADASAVAGLESFDGGLVYAVSGAGGVGARLWKREVSAGDSGFVARQLNHLALQVLKVGE